MKQSWIRRVPWFRRATVPWRHTAAAMSAAAVDELPVDPDKPWGCGWFDSSLDLRQGLAVIEHSGLPLELAVQLMLAPEAARA